MPAIVSCPLLTDKNVKRTLWSYGGRIGTPKTTATPSSSKNCQRASGNVKCSDVINVADVLPSHVCQLVLSDVLQVLPVPTENSERVGFRALGRTNRYACRSLWPRSSSPCSPPVGGIRLNAAIKRRTLPLRTLCASRNHFGTVRHGHSENSSMFLRRRISAHVGATRPVQWIVEGLAPTTRGS
jgi:hypothetical protein